jgi:hypothetical protein
MAGTDGWTTVRIRDERKEEIKRVLAPGESISQWIDKTLAHALAPSNIVDGLTHALSAQNGHLPPSEVDLRLDDLDHRLKALERLAEHQVGSYAD